jgi:hypothetical protein
MRVSHHDLLAGEALPDLDGAALPTVVVEPRQRPNAASVE